MPYTAQQRAYFNYLAQHPAEARRRGVPAHKLAEEANRLAGEGRERPKIGSGKAILHLIQKAARSSLNLR